MAKRIVLTSIGSYGDLHPFIATGLARGFEAVIAASEYYRGKVQGAGLAFHPVRPTPAKLLADTGLDEGGFFREAARSSTLVFIDKMIVPYAEQSYEDLCDALRGADLVVTSGGSLVARVAIAKLRLPSVSLMLSPCLFFSAEQPTYFAEAPGLPALRRALGPGAVRLVWALGRLRMGWHTRRITALRRRLGLPPLRGDEVMDGPLQADWIAALYSPLLGPLPPEAPGNCEIAGFTFYDSERGDAPSLPPPLAEFLAAGPAPLVFTLGSWGVHAAGRFYEQAASTAARLGMRAVLLVGAEAEGPLARLASKDVFVAGYVSHSLVFPHAAAIIHHGGIGTVGQALRAGRPQLICPLFGDQFDNAERLIRLGVGRRLDHKRFSAARAASALADLLADPVAAAHAPRLGVQVAAEDGAAFVADRLARMLG